MQTIPEGTRENDEDGVDGHTDTDNHVTDTTNKGLKSATGQK